MNMTERELLLQTEIAGLVAQIERLGAEARIAFADIENPPEVEIDDDPLTGDWIYRIKKEGK